MIKLKWDLREARGFVSPKGPDYDKSQSITLNIDNTEISFNSPKHDPWENSVTSHCIASSSAYDAPERGCETIGDWQFRSLLYRNVSFYGPILTGVPADLGLSVYLYHRKKANQDTLFNPTFFESQVLDILSLKFSQFKFHGASNWRAPLNWNIFDKKEVNGITLNAKSANGAGGQYLSDMYIPIQNHAFILVACSLNRHASGSLEEQDRKIDIKPLEQLRDQIFSSVCISLSDDAKSQKKLAEKDYPHARHSQTIEPLKWTTDEEDREHAEWLKAVSNATVEK